MGARARATRPLIVIVGETASGKTELAIKLAERLNGEIVCADSRTVYRGMDIGTAKPSKEEQAKVRHHLLDVVSPDERFTVVEFKRLANEAIEDISRRGKLPIMVGGTGLYVDAVLFDYGFAPSDALRDPKNPRHLSPESPGVKQALRPDTLVLGLKVTREMLKERITRRVDAMFDSGLIEEATWLADRYGWDCPALQAPAYKAARSYVQGALSLDEAKALFITSDEQLAKRQRTWFKRNNSIHWAENRDNIVDIATTFLSKMTTAQDKNLLQ